MINDLSDSAKYHLIHFLLKQQKKQEERIMIAPSKINHPSLHLLQSSPSWSDSAQNRICE